MNEQADGAVVCVERKRRRRQLMKRTLLNIGCNHVRAVCSERERQREQSAVLRWQTASGVSPPLPELLGQQRETAEGVQRGSRVQQRGGRHDGRRRKEKRR